MSSVHKQDPLVGLWQMAPKPDVQNLLQYLQRANQLHRRLNRSLLAIVTGMALLLGFEEATGRLQSHGALTLIWIMGLVVGYLRRRRACKNAGALTLDTVSLLKRMLARANSDLLIARCLYAGVPCGAVTGFIVFRLAGLSAPIQSSHSNSHLQTIQTGAGVAALVIMVGAGLALSRSRTRLSMELKNKLQSLSDEL